MPRRDQDGFDAQEAAEAISIFRRLDPRVQIVVVVLLVVAAIVFAIAYLKSQHTPGAAPPAGYSQMLLGNPSAATSSSGDRDNYLMTKPYYALSYNDSKGIANWVSWEVSAADLGEAPRKETFDPDSTLPAGFTAVITRDYNGSGFDRGHMCPHSDRAANQEMSFSTFVMTNIIPQAPNVNRKAWEQLESYGRELVSQEHDRLYITAGPAGQGGRGSRGPAQTLAGGRVTVPAECWKIIVVVPETGGNDDLAKINSQTRVITVLMPNDQTQVKEEWTPFRTNVVEVEKVTGLHFFGSLRGDIALALREKVDEESVSPPRAHLYAD
jgi:endonuclease G